MRRIRSHLSYANVISTLCLFLLLSGGTAVALNGSNTVQSDDIGPGAQVKAADIAPSALAKGRAATRQNGCHPTSAAFADCGHVTMSLPRSVRVLIVATATWDGDGSFAAGECRIGVDGAPFGPNARPGSTLGNTAPFYQSSVALTNVTGPLAPGSHTFGLACNAFDGSMFYDSTYVSAVALGPG
jgi:hypothetical protein